MKTLKEWRDSKIGFSKYITEPCEIDYELWDLLASQVVPYFTDGDVMQCGDPDQHKEYEDLIVYETILTQNGKYYYLGCLPEFKKIGHDS